MIQLAGHVAAVHGFKTLSAFFLTLGVSLSKGKLQISVLGLLMWSSAFVSPEVLAGCVFCNDVEGCRILFKCFSVFYSPQLTHGLPHDVRCR